MKKIYLSLICTLLFVGANAQITYGFDYKENYQSFSNKDANSSVIIALYNTKQDSTLQAYSAILSVEDNVSDPSLNGKNGIHFSITPVQQKVEFAPGQLGFRNEKLIKINQMLKTDLKQIAYNSSFVVFGLPLQCKTTEELERKIANVGYCSKHSCNCKTDSSVKKCA